MGIDYSGGMIVGENKSEVPIPDEYEDDGDFCFEEWIEDNDMDTMSEHYDACADHQIIGFLVSDVPVSEIDHKWLEGIKGKAAKFKELTGVDARLIGTQDIW